MCGCRGSISTHFMAAKFPPGEVQPSDATHFEARCHCMHEPFPAAGAKAASAFSQIGLCHAAEVTHTSRDTLSIPSQRMQPIF